MLIVIYQILSVLLSPFLHLFLLYRAYQGKEEMGRLSEKFGFSNIKRPAGKLIWLHAASVGESLMALALIDILNSKYKKLNFLLTTGTVSVAKNLQNKLPANAHHQYTPMDCYLNVRIFLDHWQPDLALFVESEIWPNLISLTSSRCPILLLNARISDRSCRRWLKYKNTIAKLLAKFDHIISQSKYDTENLNKLGAKNIITLHNLKYASPKLPCDESKLKQLQQDIAKRPIFLAVSTHPGDEEIMCEMHLHLRQKYEQILTIIVPRHTYRTADIVKLIERKNLTYKLRDNSLVEPRSFKETDWQQADIYVANTMGELGVFFALAPVSFIGGSFKNGGHNPIEPAHFATNIIFGPDMSNFKVIAEDFTVAKAAKQSHNKEQLAQDLTELFMSKYAPAKSALVKNSSKLLAQNSKVIDEYMKYIGRYLGK